MNILAIGDVVGSVGCRFLRSHLPALKKTYHIDVVIANGENSADGNGITPVSAQYLYQSGETLSPAGTTASAAGRCTPLWTRTIPYCARTTTRRTPPRGKAFVSTIWDASSWRSSI